MNEPIEAIVFDLGNVLLTLDWDTPARRLGARTGRTRQQLDDYFAQSPWAHQLALGQLEKLRFFELVAAELDFPGDYEEFAWIWSDMFIPNEPMLALAHRLQGGMPRLILSNTNAIHMEFIFGRFPWLEVFDGHVFSHEVGLAKPDPRIYRYAVRRFRLSAPRTVFIDDLQENVEAARAIGLQGLHYQTREQMSRELTNLGLGAI